MDAHITINPKYEDWRGRLVPAVRLANGTEHMVPEPMRTGKMYLDEEFKLLWIMALLSGVFPQAQNALHVVRVLRRDKHQTVGYCCLGVAGAIHPNAQSQVITTSIRNSHCRVELFFRTGAVVDPDLSQEDLEELAGELPPELAGEVGLTREVQYYLAWLNDAGATFEEIAAVIDLYL